MKTRQLLATVVKFSFSAVLVGFLASRAYNDESFQALALQPKNWPLLLTALPICLLAVTVTILRWHMLVRTLNLTFTVRDTLRAGFLGYACNLIPVGLVAGDSVKAVMLIHKNPLRKTEAVASVLVDRVIGLYGLLLLAAVASLFLPTEQIASLEDPAHQATIVNLCYGVRTIAVLSTFGLIVLLIPGVTHSRLWDLLEHMPLAGPVLHKLVGAMRAYRRRVDLLLAGIGISLVVHSLYVASVVLMTMSIGIPPEFQPPPRYIVVIVPPTMIAGALPIGIYELTVTLLFQAISPEGAPENMGLLIALAYRIIQVLIASIGVGYWLTSRSQVQEIMHAAEEKLPEANGESPVAAGA